MLSYFTAENMKPSAIISSLLLKKGTNSFTNILYIEIIKIPLKDLGPGKHFLGRALEAKISGDNYEYDYTTVEPSRVTAVKITILKNVTHENYILFLVKYQKFSTEILNRRYNALIMTEYIL